MIGIEGIIVGTLVFFAFSQNKKFPRKVLIGIVLLLVIAAWGLGQWEESRIFLLHLALCMIAGTKIYFVKKDMGLS